MFQHEIRKRVVTLGLFMALVAACAGAFAIWMGYEIYLGEKRSRLEEIVQTRAHILDTLLKEHVEAGDVSSVEMALAAFRELHAQLHGFGDSGEITVARMEGERMLYVVRHQHGAGADGSALPAMTVDVSASRGTTTGLPMQHALAGEIGTLIGPDYRGTSVLAAYHPTRMGTFGVVVKVDMRELRAPFLRAGGWLVGGFLVVVLTGWAIFMRSSALILQRISDFATILKSVGDAVMATDHEGRVTFMNAVAEELTEWTLEEARGRSISDVFKIINAITRQSVLDPVAHVFATGKIVGLANHTVLIGKTGTERHIADSGAPVRDTYGNIRGVVLVFRDVSEDYRLREALQTSEERLHLAMDATSDGIWDWNPATGEIYLTPHAEEMLGYAPGEFVPHIHSIESLIYPDDQPRVLRCMEEHLEGQTATFTAEYRIWTRHTVDPDPSHTEPHTGQPVRKLIWVLGRGKVVARDAQGRPVRMVGTYTDITSLKQTESELRRRNRALRAIRAASEALVHAIDEQDFMQELCCLIVQKAQYHLAWIGLAQFDAGRSVKVVAQCGDRTHYLDGLHISWEDGPLGRGPTGTAIRTMHDAISNGIAPDGVGIRTGTPLVVRDVQTDENFAPWRQRAMEMGYRSSIALPFAVDAVTFGTLNVYASEAHAFDEGEVDLLLNLVHDLAFGVKSLRDQMDNRRLRLAVEQTDDMILVSDSTGTVQYVNRAFSMVTGYTPAEAVGRSSEELLRSDETPQATINGMWQTLALGQTWYGRFVNRKKDGTLFHVEANISPVWGPEGSIRHYVAVYRDVTRQEQVERQLRQAQKMDAIGTLSGGIAHDFNNILSVILGYTELVMRRMPTDHPSRQDLQSVFQAGIRARDLVKQLLTFSRRTDGVPKPTQVAPIVREALRFMRSTVPATVTIRSEVPDLDVYVMGDATRIHQVLMNLCTNAALAMEGQSDGVLTVSLSRQALTHSVASGMGIAEGDYVVIAVEDTGTGMPMEVQQQIFDPFFTTRGVGKGTGLGLAVVHGIVTEAKGYIHVESTLGVGSRLTVFWPLVAMGDADATVAMDVPMAPRPFHILFIDDEVAIARLAGQQLLELGYRVTVFTDPHAAWKAFIAAPQDFDAVLSDQTMPGMTGTELFERMRSLRPDIPVVLCSGRQAVGSLDEVRAMGLRATLQKPLLVEDLARTLFDVFAGPGAG
jgi:PAS domain S-box-containing protein